MGHAVEAVAGGEGSGELCFQIYKLHTQLTVHKL